MLDHPDEAHTSCDSPHDSEMCRLLTMVTPALAGGGLNPNTPVRSGVYLYESGPISSTTWRSTMRNTTGSSLSVTVRAICANAG